MQRSSSGFMWPIYQSLYCRRCSGFTFFQATLQCFFCMFVALRPMHITILQSYCDAGVVGRVCMPCLLLPGRIHTAEARNITDVSYIKRDMTPDPLSKCHEGIYRYIPLYTAIIIPKQCTPILRPSSNISPPGHHLRHFPLWDCPTQIWSQSNNRALSTEGH